MDIGIIGFGQFGQFFAKHLKDKAEIFVADKSDKSEETRKLDINFVGVKEAASKDIVILAVPISELKNALAEIMDSVKKDAIVMDVCSVKAVPCKLMKEMLPENIEIIGTHPLFGPQSGQGGIRGLKIVVCPVRAKKLDRIVTLFEELGLKVIISTAEEHDRSMATSHALMHFIAKGMINIGIRNHDIKISALDKAIEMMDIFKEDSEQLFKDIQNFNPFSKEIREQFLKELEKINNELTK